MIIYPGDNLIPAVHEGKMEKARNKFLFMESTGNNWILSVERVIIRLKIAELICLTKTMLQIKGFNSK